MAGSLLLVWAFSFLASAPDTSGPSHKCADEDRDAQGRLIWQVGKDGLTKSYTYDRTGRIVKIEIGKSGVTPKGDWVHTFIYEGEELKAEVDCLGTERSFCDSPLIDIKKGTALSRHRHPKLPIFWLGEPPKKAPKARKP